VIASLRHRHRQLIAGLALAAPVAIVAALAARNPPVSTPAFPAPLAREFSPVVPEDALPVLESALLWPGLSVQTRVLTDAGALYLELMPHEAVRAPALMLYASMASAADASLPADARLLGPFAGSHKQAYALGPNSPASLWLFSLAHGEVVARASLAAIRP
jgi:hypothetical protein